MILIVHTRNLIIKQLPNSISERLSKHSSNQEIFKTTKIEYEDPLKKSGYNVDLKYTNSKLEKTKTQKRNIIRFNPTFSKSISTNVAKIFPHLVTKHFPRSHTLHKIAENENAECPMEGNCQVSDEIYK